MGEPRLFKTIISKLLNSPTEDWNIQVKSESNSSVNSQGNLNDIEIEYRVEHQAKFLLKTQLAPTLRWFSSQDGLDKLFEKSQISSDTTNLTKQHDFEKLSSNQSGPPPTSNDNNDSLIGTVATPFPSITDASSVPEINVLGVYHRTRAQASSSSELLTDTSTSLRSEENETQCSSQVCDQISIPSTSLDILGEEEILEHDENIQNNVRWSGNSTTDSCVEGPVIQSQGCQTALFALQQRKELTQTKSEPKLVHCSEDKLSGSSNSDTHRQEAVAVRSAPILPSERTVFKTDDNIILVVEGQKVHVSKVLLSLHSEFFKAMFATDMKESQQSEIELPSIKYKILQQILQFCQKGELSVNSENVHHLLHTAHLFQISPVIEMCEHFLVHILRQDVLLELMDIADHYLLVRLLKACFKLIGNKFQQLHIQGILKQIKHEHLLALLESDLHLPDATEFQIFKLIIEWVSKDVDSNKQHLGALLSLVKFTLMQTTELSQINKRQESWLKENEVFQQQLKLAFKYKNCIHEQPLMGGLQALPRGAVKTVTLIVEDDSILSECNSLDCHLVPVGTSSQIQTQMFITHKMKLEWSRDGYSVATLNNFLYVGGGYNPSEDRNLSSVHRYNPATGKWVSVQPMRHRRAAFVLGSLGSHLYAVGGRQFDSHLHAAFGLRAKTLNSVECYDCASDSWTKVANLPVGLFAHAGASCNGRMYVSGGRTDEPMGMEDTNALVCYHDDTDAWVQCAPMQHNRYYHGMAAVDQKIYVAGGVNYNPSDAYGVWNFVTEPESYNSVTGQWTSLALMPHRRSQVAVTAVAQKIYVIGGLPHPGVDGKREVLEYSIEKDEWQPSKLKYPAFWPTQCCTLYFSPSVIEHAAKLSDFERDRRPSSGREVLYSLSRIPH